MRRRRSPVRPILIANFLRCSKPDCKQGECAAHPEVAQDAMEEKEVRREDVDFGNHIVGPSSPRTKPTTLKSPRELKDAEMETDMATHLPYYDSCPPIALLGADATTITEHLRSDVNRPYSLLPTGTCAILYLTAHRLSLLQTSSPTRSTLPRRSV